MDKVTEKLKEVISKQERLLKLKITPQQSTSTSPLKTVPSVKTPLSK